MNSTAPHASTLHELDRLRGALARLHLQGMEARVLRDVSDYFERHAVEILPLHRSSTLTAAERAALERAGVEVDDAPGDPGPLLDAVARHAALRATALPLAEAAQLLGVNPSRLRQRLADGSLVGVRLDDGRSWGLPVFQFVGEGELPGLRETLRAIRRDARPVQVAAFFATPQGDLEAPDGSAMTPFEWLRQGGSPAAVAEIAASL